MMSIMTTKIRNASIGRNMSAYRTLYGINMQWNLDLISDLLSVDFAYRKICTNLEKPSHTK